MSEQRQFVFLVHDFEEVKADQADEFASGEGDLERHVRVPFFHAKQVTVTDEQLKSFWEDKVVGLTATLTEAQDEQPPKGFRVDEIAFSIGVGVQGGFMFVAQASADASISVTLRRSD